MRENNFFLTETGLPGYQFVIFYHILPSFTIFYIRVCPGRLTK